MLGSVLGLIVLAGATAGGGLVYMDGKAQERLTRTWPDVQGKDLPIPFPLSPEEIDALRQERLAALPPADPAAPVDPSAAPVDPLAGVDLDALATERAVARGNALVHGRLPCGECHGLTGEGKLVADAQPVWTWYAPNITKGGKTKDYTPRDWDRIIRHGIKRDGSTATMPAVDFMSLSDQEVSDLALYFMNLPASDAVQPEVELGPLGKVLLGTGTLPLSAELIDHNKVNPVYPPEPALSLEFGAHVAATCAGCHRVGFNGGPIAQGPPDWPPSANLTQGGALTGYSEEDFIRVFREAKRPDGSAIAEPMASITKMNISDLEIQSMFLFFQSLPPVPTGE